MKYPLYVAALIVALIATGCGGGAKEEPKTEVAPAAQPAAPAAMDSADAATVMGKVNFTGAKPTARPIRMDAEKYCAEQHGGAPVPSEEVVINSDGTLANVFVWVKDGLGDRSFPVPAEPAKLDQKGCMYTPHVMGMVAGQNLEVTNSDETTHNVHPQPKENQEWNMSQPPKAAPISKAFAREEMMVPVKCNVHPWMKSYIGVVKHPFFAVTGKDGSFTIKGLPPGDYTIAAWHEKYKTVEQKVTVGAKESKTVDFSITG